MSMVFTQHSPIHVPILLQACLTRGVPRVLTRQVFRMVPVSRVRNGTGPFDGLAAACGSTQRVIDLMIMISAERPSIEYVERFVGKWFLSPLINRTNKKLGDGRRRTWHTWQPKHSRWYFPFNWPSDEETACFSIGKLHRRHCVLPLRRHKGEGNCTSSPWAGTCSSSNPRTKLHHCHCQH